MSLKRTDPSYTLQSDTEDSSYYDSPGPSKRQRLDSPWNTQGSADLSPIKVHILSTKLDTVAFQHLTSLTEHNVLPAKQKDGISATMRSIELTLNPEEADVIVTAIRTRSRLQRHVDLSLVKSKAVVTPEWLEDSVESGILLPYSSYSVLRDHHAMVQLSGNIEWITPLESPEQEIGKPQLLADPELVASPRNMALLDFTSRYSCQRASPLFCPNQNLVEELDIIRRSRTLEGEERSMLSYSRAIASIKAYPHRITEANVHDEVARLPYLGEKILSMIEEYINTGQIAEAQTISSSPRFVSLSAFVSVHGIGPQTARKLYSLGLRSLEELDKYYEVTPGILDDETLALHDGDVQRNEDTLAEISIRVSLALRHELSQTIPREEVEEIHETIVLELAKIQDGCKSLIVGGYRRGKPQSNDVDIVISHTDWTLGSRKAKGLCARLLQRLHERRLVTHVMHLSGFHKHNVLHTHHWDSLEKALTVFSLPSDAGGKRVSRRVDLIFTAPEAFWTAVVGWTGSITFQRDLRLWAKQQKNMKFDSSGISRRRDSKLYYPKSERDVFEVLGLAFVHPTLRNAD